MLHAHLLTSHAKLMVIKSHTGVTLARAFQVMLERHGLQHKVSCLLFISDSHSYIWYRVLNGIDSCWL
jgi:hypothetical protein